MGFFAFYWDQKLAAGAVDESEYDSAWTLVFHTVFKIVGGFVKTLESFAWEAVYEDNIAWAF